MNSVIRNMALRQAQKMYDKVSDDIKEDLYLAMIWAKTTLTNHEGSGHIFQVFSSENEEVCANFHKPEWAGDHTGSDMPTSSEAVVMAVCEYLSGA